MHRTVCLLFAFLLSLPAASNAQWTWPDKPENLQVLPADWPGSRLAPVMRGFTRALGVRCSHCHVGEEGQPLSTYDFASDDNPNKNKAREMLRMLGDINDHLKKIEPSGERVNMWCHTCHRGRPRPMTLAEEIGETYRSQGIDSALAHYATLKDRFYGKGAYNFEDESAFNEVGYEALGENDVDGAIRFFELNGFLFPQSANVWDSLAEGYMKAGNDSLAIKYYRRSLTLNPRNENAKEMIDRLLGGTLN